MELTELYAQIQANPRNLQAFRKLAKHYDASGMKTEADAILFLIQRKFQNGTDDTDRNEQ